VAILRSRERGLGERWSLASAHGGLGRNLIFGGRPAEGLVAVEKSIRLDPRDPLLALRLNRMVVSYYCCRDYEAAVIAAKRALRAYPDYPLPHRWLAAALGQALRLSVHYRFS
jgi:adenylate cyclase